LLLTDDPTVDHLTNLDWGRRTRLRAEKHGDLRAAITRALQGLLERAY
jgi:hypothetical protein